MQRLGVGGKKIYTLRATAWLRTPAGTPSQTRRSVAALVKFLEPPKFTEPYHVLRWYDDVWVQ
jgi:hypothetical protein